MSTRAVIGYIGEGGWKGVYQHDDGYPQWLGEKLTAILKEHGAAHIKEIVDNHPGGYSTIAHYKTGERECYCHHPKWKSHWNNRPLVYRTDAELHDHYIDWLYLVNIEDKVMGIYKVRDSLEAPLRLVSLAPMPAPAPQTTEAPHA